MATRTKAAPKRSKNPKPHERTQVTSDPQLEPDKTPDVDPAPNVEPVPASAPAEKKTSGKAGRYEEALKEIASGQVVAAGKLIRRAQQALDEG